MQCITVFTVALLLLASILIAVSGDKSGYLKHNNMLKEYCCGAPKPRVFELEEVIDKDTLKDLTGRGLRKEIRPSVTVLHRCEATGFCEDSDKRCMPSVKENVTLTFRYVERSMKYLEVTVEDHKECKCAETDSSSIK